MHNTISSFVSSLISKHPYPYFNLNTITSAADILSVDSYMSIYACSGSGRIRTYSALRQQIYSLSRLANCGADPILISLNMSKTKFVVQIYRQYFNYPNILTKMFCGPNENRTRVSIVTNWKDNHYPIRPIFSTPYRIRTCDPQLRTYDGIRTRNFFRLILSRQALYYT